MTFWYSSYASLNLKGKLPFREAFQSQKHLEVFNFNANDWQEWQVSFITSGSKKHTCSVSNFWLTYHLQKIRWFYVSTLFDKQRNFFHFRLSWMAGKSLQIPQIQLKITKLTVKQIKQIINFFILLVRSPASFTPPHFSFLQLRKSLYRINGIPPNEC